MSYMEFLRHFWNSKSCFLPQNHWGRCGTSEKSHFKQGTIIVVIGSFFLDTTLLSNMLCYSGSSFWFPSPIGMLKFGSILVHSLINHESQSVKIDHLCLSILILVKRLVMQLFNETFSLSFSLFVVIFEMSIKYRNFFLT